jgi:hypothetical protein
MSTSTEDNSDPEIYEPEVLSVTKWALAIGLGILFLILALPCTYRLSNSVWTSLGFKSYVNNRGGVNVTGVVIHAIIFALIIRIILL